MILFYSLFAGTIGLIGYNYYKSIWEISDGITDRDINTSSNDVYSELKLYLKV